METTYDVLQITQFLLTQACEFTKCYNIKAVARTLAYVCSVTQYIRIGIMYNLLLLLIMSGRAAVRVE